MNVLEPEDIERYQHVVDADENHAVKPCASPAQEMLRMNVNSTIPVMMDDHIQSSSMKATLFSHPKDCWPALAVPFDLDILLPRLFT